MSKYKLNVWLFLFFICVLEIEVLVQFKKATLEGKISLVACWLVQSILAYLVNERKVRIFNTETGQNAQLTGLKVSLSV